MVLLAQAIGVLMVLAAFVLLARPAVLKTLVPALIKGARVYLVAALRFGAGCVFIVAAPAANHPLVVEVLGWLAATAGLLMVVIPPRSMARLMMWIADLPTWVSYIWALIAALMGGFLIWTFL